MGESGDLLDQAARRERSYAQYVLVSLLVVYTINFVDRQIVGILAIPIKHELALTDSQLGMMGGLAFALFYTALGIPASALADKTNRTWVITIALALWSAMTALCGTANSFAQLFLARMGVGVGEAGGVAPAYALICDYFPREQRARALSFYTLGIPIGSSLGIVAGGYLSTVISWRVAFITVGVAGILVAVIFRSTVREPTRGLLDSTSATSFKSPAEVLQFLRTKPAFWYLALGNAVASMMTYGTSFWLPSFLSRSFRLSTWHSSLAFGLLMLLGGTIGSLVGGTLGDRYGLKSRRVYAVFPAIALTIAVPFYAIGLSCDALWKCLVLLLVPIALGLTWLGSVISAAQHLVPPGSRATASAIYTFLNSLIGIGLGTLLIGMLSDFLHGHFGEQALRYAILSSTAVYVVAAGFFLLAARSIQRDWEGP